METIGTSLPRKWRDNFDNLLDETLPEATQSDGIAAGLLLWMCLEVEERLYMLQLARNIRKNKSNDLL